MCTPRTINYLYPSSPSFFFHNGDLHMYNDLPIRVTIRAVGAPKPDAGGPPPNVMPLHAPRCKSPWALHATASTALKYEAHASTAENRNCRSLRASNSPRSSGFSSNAQSWTLPGAALQRPHKPPSSAALGASDPKLSLNQRAVSTAVSGWVGCASA